MKTIIKTEKAPPPIGPYNQAVAVQGQLLFTAGQIALNPKPQRHPHRKSFGFCPCCENDRLPEKHERLRCHERSVRQIFWRGFSGSEYDRSCPLAEGCVGGN